MCVGVEGGRFCLRIEAEGVFGPGVGEAGRDCGPAAFRNSGVDGAFAGCELSVQDDVTSR